MRRNILLAAAAIAVVSGCAQQQALWQKPGADVDAFNRDKYACMQQSQQQMSSAYVGKYGGYAGSQMITNGNLFSACLNSQGWHLSQITNVKAYNDAMAPLAAEMRQICIDLEASLSQKMRCKSKDASPQQLADRSKISGSEKIPFLKFRSAINDLNRKVAAVDREFMPRDGDAMASAMEAFIPLNNKIADDLVQGKITWGEYNQRRIEYGKKYEQSLKVAMSISS